MAKFPAGLVVVILAVSSLATIVRAEDPPVFSGPQVGEKLTPFTIRGVFGDAAGTKIELAPDDHRGPVVLMFVHELTRPSVAVIRLVSRFNATRVEHKLQSAVIFLTDDATETEKRLHAAEQALPEEGALGISLDGIEGPGAYGLNRKVALTVLVATDQKVTANFALVQPSVKADVPKILAAIAEVTGGGEVPTVEELLRRERAAER